MFTRRLTMEPLERRLLLAGDVVVQLRGGWLEIVGDNDDNQVQVERLEGNRYEVTGKDETRLVDRRGDELDNPVIIEGVTRGIRADLKQGDDTLVLLGNVDGDLRVNMGDGSDQVMIGSEALKAGQDPFVVTGRTTIDLGRNGLESSFLSGNTDFGRDVTIRAGHAPQGEEGEVEVGILNANINGRLNITTGNTDDSIGLFATQVGRDVNIRTGDGNDSVIILGYSEDDDEVPPAPEVSGEEEPAPPRSEIGGRTTVDLGRNGVSTAHLESMDLKGDVTIRAGNRPRGAVPDEEEGEFDVIDCTITGRLSVTTGDTNDYIFLYGVQVTRDVTIRSGNAARGTEGEVYVSVYHAEIDGRLNITTGNTDDWIELRGVQVARDVAIRTGDGEDWVDIGDSWGANGNGDWDGDEVFGHAEGEDENGPAVPSSIGGRLNVDIGRGTGGIELWGTTVKRDVSLRAGDGVPEEEGSSAHEVYVWDSTIEGSLSVNLGRGGSFVGLWNVSIDRDVNIRTGDGDDYIDIDAGDWDDEDEENGLFEVLEENDVVRNQFGGNLNVRTGNGNNAVAVANSNVVRALSIDAGNGDNVVAVAAVDVQNGNVSIRTGRGNDAILVADLNAASNVTINTGNAPVSEDEFSGDAVLLTKATVEGNLSITTGNGDDMVGIGDSDLIAEVLEELSDLVEEADLEWLEDLIELGPVTVTGRTNVRTGAGYDDLAIGSSDFTGAVSIDMGNDDDFCAIEDSIFNDIAVQMGRGDDDLDVMDNEVFGRLNLDGGAGDDWLLEDGDDFDPETTSNTVEDITRMRIRNFSNVPNFP